MARVVLRPRARIDLAEIWDFIAEGHETRADAFIDEIDARFRALADSPSCGPAQSLTSTLRNSSLRGAYASSNPAR